MVDISFNSLAVIVSVERIPYLVKGSRAVGMNISVALEEGAAVKMNPADVEKLLCPWLWDVKGVKLLVRDNTTKKCQSVGATIIGDYRKVRSDNADFLCRIKSLLKNRFSKATKQGALYWTPGLPTPGKTEPANDEVVPPWQVQIAEQFVLPAPITALLNLSCIATFKLPSGVTDFSCLASPEFSVKLAAGTATFAPKVDDALPDDCLGKSADPDVRIWAYKSNASFPVNAYLKAADPPVDDPDNLLECSTLLLRKDGLPDSDVDRADDWLVRLGIRAADGFDLARAVLECSAEAAKKDANQPLFRGLTLFFLAALRDQSGIGYMRGPDQRSLLAVALTGWRKNNPMPSPAAAVCDDSTPKACADAEKSKWPDMPKWIATLESVATTSPHFRDALQILKNAADPTAASVPLRQVVDGMQVVYGEVTNESFLGTLVLVQWETLRAGGMMPYASPSFISYVRNDILPQQQLRRRMLLGVVGRYWKALTDFNSGNATQRVQQLRDNFVSVWTQYVVDRSTGTQFYPSITVDQAVIDKVKEYAARWAKGYASTALVPPGTQAVAINGVKQAVSSPTLVPQSLAFFGENPAQDASDKQQDQKDPLRCVRGLSLMLRRTQPTATRWRCLNAGIAVAKAPATGGDCAGARPGG